MKLIIISSMWCPACINMHKVWNKIEDEYKNVEIVKYDYDMDEETVKSYNPGEVLPVMILVNDGIEKDRISGEKTFEEIKEMIEK